MKLEEMKRDKKELENKINTLINEFQNKYDVEVYDINFSIEIAKNIKGETVYRDINTNIKINL